jgi:tRNA nucleotidyltransferase (CCA-adding enzyme)
MSITTSYKEALHNKIFEVISQASQQLNVDSYVIGGFVRDLILKEILKRHRYCCCAAE